MKRSASAGSSAIWSTWAPRLIVAARYGRRAPRPSSPAARPRRREARGLAGGRGLGAAPRKCHGSIAREAAPRSRRRPRRPRRPLARRRRCCPRRRTGRPAGRRACSAPCSAQKSAAWSAIQWNVAVERTASTPGSCRGRARRGPAGGTSRARSPTRPRGPPRACRAQASTAITLPAGQALEQLLGHAARSRSPRRGPSRRRAAPAGRAPGRPCPASARRCGRRSCRPSRVARSSRVASSAAERRSARRRRRPGSTRSRDLAGGLAATCPARARRRSRDRSCPAGRRRCARGGSPASPSLRLERLQAVVARQPAAEARADVAERQVDLVVEDEDVVELDPRGAARRADAESPASFMNVWGSRTATRGPPGAVPALGEQAVELLARRAEVPAARSARARPRSRRCAACPRSATRGCPARRPASRRA